VTSLDDRAKHALNKSIVPDLDSEIPPLDKLTTTKTLEVREARYVSSYIAQYVQLDNRILFIKSLSSDVEMYTLDEALDRFPDLVQRYSWKALPVDLDRFTALSHLKRVGGYFIRVKPGAKISIPIQTCFFMSGGYQIVKNIVVVERGAEAVIVTGCSIAPEVLGLHVSTTEIYLEEGAKLIDVTIHSWNRVTHVRSRKGVVLGRNSTYVSYYLNFASANTLHAYLKSALEGEGSRSVLMDVVLGRDHAKYSLETQALLQGTESSAELVSKLLARDEARISARLRIEAYADRSRGYTECSALMLSPRSIINTIPELVSYNNSSELHHEASIGKLRDEELEYLQLKGFNQREAVSILVRGFIQLDLSFLSAELRKSLDAILDAIAKASSS